MVCQISRHKTVLGLRFVLPVVQNGRYWKSRYDDGTVYGSRPSHGYDMVRYKRYKYAVYKNYFVSTRKANVHET